MIKFNKIHNNKAISILYGENAGPRSLYAFGSLMLFLIASAPVADAGCSCSAGNWELTAQGFLNIDDAGGQPVISGSPQNSVAASKPKAIARSESFPNGKILKPMKSVSSSDIVLDVSNGKSYAKSHIKNSIHIPTKEFLDSEGNLKTNEELAKALGDFGISREDSVVLYGSKESSGEAEFAFLILRYLGQMDVKLLDGSLADWKAAGLPEDVLENKRTGVEYKPEVKPGLIANYEYVKSGQAQIMDVRPFAEFGKGRIPGSMSLDPSILIKGDKIRDVNGLNTIFQRLDRDKPVVVFSDDYSRTSLVWYALQLMGYDASVYTWEDWKAHEASDKNKND